MAEVAIVKVPERGCVEARVAEGLALRAGDACVLERPGGPELGHVRALGAGTAGNAPVTRVSRLATPDDLARARTNRDLAGKALRAFAEELSREQVPVKAVSAHFSLDRARLTVLYGATQPFDGRQVVGVLQRRFGAHVELRQVGVRDEVALLGGIGACGRTTCCASWLRHFRSVNVRMAKAQELSLNPTSINGCCGRLKCCLRYEYDAYREAGAALPRDGAWVTWPGGEGTVIGRDVMLGRLTVRTRDGRLVHVSGAEAVARPGDGQAGEPPRDGAGAGEREEEQDEDPRGEWSEPETAGDA